MLALLVLLVVRIKGVPCGCEGFVQCELLHGWQWWSGMARIRWKLLYAFSLSLAHWENIWMEVKPRILMVRVSWLMLKAPGSFSHGAVGKTLQTRGSFPTFGSCCATCQPGSLGKLQTRLWKWSPTALPALTLSLNQAHHLALAVIHLSPPGATLFPALRLKQGSWKGWGQCISHECAQ